MTKRLMELNIKMLLVLEGGYNVSAISDSAAGAVRALIHDESLPEPITIAENQMRNTCSINPIIHAQLDYIIDVLGENWEILKAPELRAYTEMIKTNKNKIYGQVSDGSSSSESFSEDEEGEITIKEGEEIAMAARPSKSMENKVEKSKGKKTTKSVSKSKKKEANAQAAKL